MKNTQLRIRVLLALQAALLGMVTKRMHAVLVSWDEVRVNLRVVFDNELVSEDVELVGEIETQIISHLPEHSISAVADVVSTGEKTNQKAGEVFVFLRQAGDYR